jgi:hypothetical protein
MKKIGFVIVSVVALSLPFAAQAYEDSFHLTGLGLFGGRPRQDGSFDLRNTTTEKFDPVRGQSVVERPRPDFAPRPIDVGSFQMYPGFDIASYYDSNIYSTKNNTKDDLVSKFDPTLSLVSNWGRHAVAFTGFADINKYLNHSKENFDGGALQAQGRYDLAPQTWLGVSTAYQRDTEPRSSPDQNGSAAGPTQFDLFTGDFEAYRGVGFIQAKANYDVAYYDFDKVDLIGGGQASQNFRNRVEQGLRTEFLYDATENFKPFARLGGSFRNYTSFSQRTSSGYRVDVGSKSDFGGVVTGEAYVGFQDRNYYHFTNGNVGVVDFGGKVLWNVTDLTSIQAEAQRSIEETALANSSTYVASGGGISVTHELRRNVLLEMNGSYTNDNFKLISRSDDVYDIGVGSRYFITRNLYADATYDFQDRTSNVSNSAYQRHVALLRLGVQY